MSVRLPFSSLDNFFLFRHISPMELEVVLFVLSCVFVAALGAAARVLRRRYVESKSLSRYNAVREKKTVIPDTLHPVFDPQRCIGSGTCTRICPQGDAVLGRIGGRGVLIDPSMCIGHGRCAAECPMGAIRLVFGTSERGVDLPNLSPSFETNVHGLYITGELGGMGLIGNAVRQATEGMENIRTALSKIDKSRAAEGGNDDDILDVIIIGAGPAGMTSALFAANHGMSYRLLDKETDPGGAILRYPRRKIVMTHPMELPLIGRVNRRTMSKEELTELFQTAVSLHRIRLESGAAVDQITKDERGIFTVKGTGFEAKGRTVMLSVGRRGTPRRLNVPGEDGPNVFYGLLEPEDHAKRRVLVVGGGDSAVEAACTLAEEVGASVSLSYRQEALSRVKPKNQERFQAAVKAGRVVPLFLSEVKRISTSEAELTLLGETRTIPIDDVIVLIGGELPTALLTRIGVQIERHFGEETEALKQCSDLDVFNRIRAQARSQGLQNFHRQSSVGRKVGEVVVSLLGLAAVAALFFIGKDYYLTAEALRRDNETFAAFRASGLFGHTLGVCATFFMLMNLSYFARKEFRFLSGFGDIRTWIFIHQLSGLTAGALVLLHTGLLLNNAFASALYIALCNVVVTGIVGRYFFSMVPLDPRGRPLTHSALEDLSRRMETEFNALFGELDAAADVKAVLDLDRIATISLPRLFARLFFIWPNRFLKLLRVIRRARKEVGATDRQKAFKRYAVEMFRLRFQMDYSPKLKSVLSSWRLGHGTFALLTVFLVAAHIIVEVWVGYKWIF
jgi:thioredoxin reductase/NAD-dependent dihydropyrimidine dehydrogenase PreA subunit